MRKNLTSVAILSLCFMSALVSAQEKTLELNTVAEALDVPLSRVLQVSEGEAQVAPQPQFFGAARAANEFAAGTPVQPGELRVQASVTLKYEIGSTTKKPEGTKR